MVAKSPRQSSLCGERLAKAIADAGLRKDFVAGKSDMHPSVISSLISGARPLTRRSAERLAPVLKVPVGYLLGMEELPEDAA